MAHMKILLDGATYIGKAADEDTDVEKIADRGFESINRLNKMQLQLEDGSWLLLRDEQMKRAVVLVCP